MIAMTIENKKKQFDAILLLSFVSVLYSTCMLVPALRSPSPGDCVVGALDPPPPFSSTVDGTAVVDWTVVSSASVVTKVVTTVVNISRVVGSTYVTLHGV